MSISNRMSLRGGRVGGLRGSLRRSWRLPRRGRGSGPGCGYQLRTRRCCGRPGRHLGSLAGRDLAARCAEGQLDARGRAASRARRKRALTGESSSRWAGAITRTSEDQHRLAGQNLRAERASLRARIARIEARLAVPAGGRSGKTRGYATAAERHAKDIRCRALRARLARAERRLAAGSVPVTRGGKALLRKRANLAAAGLTEQEWRARWEAARLFLTADGEAGKRWGNETIRWHPDEGWLEVKLPAPLADLANRPHGRYRLSCPVAFAYRGDEVAAQAATGAVRYDITRDPASGRWYLDASWKTQPRPGPGAGRAHGATRWSRSTSTPPISPSRSSPRTGTCSVPRSRCRWSWPGCPPPTRDGRLRTAISGLIATARHGARAVVIEDLDFADARAEGRERTGNRPSRGRRGRAFRRTVTGIPTGKFRDRLVQMTANAGLSVIVADPAYTSRWGGAALARPAAGASPADDRASRCGAGDRATRARPPGQETRDREPHRPGGRGAASPGATQDHPVGQARTQETRHPTRPPAATRHQDQAGLTGQWQATRQPRTVRGRRIAQDHLLHLD